MNKSVVVSLQDKITTNIGEVGIRLLVTGSRNFDDVELIRSFLVSFENVEVLIQGGARGADQIARKIGLELWGAERVRTYYANWKQDGFYNKGAGIERNTQMLEEGKPNRVLAFFSDLTASKGTADMVHKAVAAGLSVRCYDKTTNTHFYATKVCKYPKSLNDLSNPEDVVRIDE